MKNAKLMTVRNRKILVHHVELLLSSMVDVRANANLLVLNLTHHMMFSDNCVH